MVAAIRKTGVFQNDDPTGAEVRLVAFSELMTTQQLPPTWTGVIAVRTSCRPCGFTNFVPRLVVPSHVGARRLKMPDRINCVRSRSRYSLGKTGVDAIYIKSSG